VYSEFTDSFCTRYRVADSPDGPWRAPEQDTVDGRAFYAAKTVEVGHERFFVGWIATKQGERDAGAWQWAGTMSVLQAHQRPDGSLRFDLPTSLKNAYSAREPITEKFRPLNGAADEIGMGAEDRYAAWSGPELAEDSIIDIELEIAPGTQSCGVMLRSSDDGEDGYAVRLEPQRSRIVFDRWPRGRTGNEQWQVLGDVPHAIELERPVSLSPGRHRLEIQLDNDMCIAVVDGEVAMSARLYDRRNGRIGLFAQDGGFALLSAAIRTRER
jgi:beta-fructofuranosidase